MVERVIVATTPRGIPLHHGNPCKVCGGTLRKADKRNHCYACAHRRSTQEGDRYANRTAPCAKCNASEWSRHGWCKPCRRASSARFQKSPKGQESYRKSHLRKRYGVTPEFVDALLLAQGGVCAICKRDKHQRQRNWHIDHDHVTGAVRGVLCATCNQGLGQFKDSADMLRSAAAYLDERKQAVS